MRHHNTNRKFGRESGQRKALLRSLAVSLVENEKIKTTEARAKELRPFIEKIITKSKKDTVETKRLLISKLGSGANLVVRKLVGTIAPKYKERQGGYTRIIKLGVKKGDSSPLVQIELV